MDTTGRDYIRELAELLHDELCDYNYPRPPRPCTKNHKGYYQDKAMTLIGRLEPDIGIANVVETVRVVIEELL